MPAWRIAGAALFVLVVVGLVHWADVPERRVWNDASGIVIVSK